MKSILLVGLGKFGQHIARRLDALGQEVLAVDNDERRVNAVLPYVTDAQIGDTTDEDFLASLGVKDFDSCIVAIGDNFQSSLETTSLLQDLGARRIVARAATDDQEKLLLRNGADRVVYPEKQTAAWVAIRCLSEHIIDCTELGDDYAILELDTPPEWRGKTVEELNLPERQHVSIVAFKQDGKLDIAVAPSSLLSASRSILVLGRQHDMQRCFHI